MSGSPKILAFAGSTRRQSHNKRLLGIAIMGAEEAGASVTRIDLRDMPMPFYDGDLEAGDGMPEAAQKLRAMVAGHDGLLIASPEYNGGYSAVLKNAIDWCSRPLPDAPGPPVFKGKTAGLISASPGGLGGLRGLVPLRQLLTNLGVLVLPGQVAVPRAGKAFTDDGRLADTGLHDAVTAVGASLAELIARLRI